jgi:hypothetical protein
MKHIRVVRRSVLLGDKPIAPFNAIGWVPDTALNRTSLRTFEYLGNLACGPASHAIEERESGRDAREARATREPQEAHKPGEPREPRDGSKPKNKPAPAMRAARRIG